MSLPYFDNVKASMVMQEPLYTNLFEVRFDDKSILTETCRDYRIDDVNKIFEVTSELNDGYLQELFNDVPKLKNPKVIHFIKTGDIKMKIEIQRSLYLGYKLEGSYTESDCLLRVKFFWKFESSKLTVVD